MKLPNFFCKIIKHKKYNTVGIGDNGVMSEAVFCRRCGECLELIGRPFSATQGA